jgi:hypothetical protein
MACHTRNTHGKQPVSHAQLAHDLAVESIKEIIVNLEVGRTWVTGDNVDFSRHLLRPNPKGRRKYWSSPELVSGLG